jgi:hypothetical protein
MRRLSWLADELLASQDEFYSTEFNVFKQQLKRINFTEHDKTFEHLS